MKITLYGKQMNVRESLKSAINRKLARFDKFFGEETEAFVTCKTRREEKIIEITFTYGQTTFRAEAGSDTFLTALDRVVETLEGQIRKNKTRLEKRVRSGAFEQRTEEDNDEYEEEGEFVIRRKSIPMRPMLPEEAILQMNLLDHSFFVFTNAEDGQAAVVYKRKDGNYGLLTPGG